MIAKSLIANLDSPDCRSGEYPGKGQELRPSDVEYPCPSRYGQCKYSASYSGRARNRVVLTYRSTKQMWHFSARAKQVDTRNSVTFTYARVSNVLCATTLRERIPRKVRSRTVPAAIDELTGPFPANNTNRTYSMPNLASAYRQDAAISCYWGTATRVTA